VQKRCFGRIVELDDARVRRTLNHSGLLDAIANLFSRQVGLLTTEARPVKLVGESYRLSDTSKFLWRRMAVPAGRTIFNRVACYNDFEARFAEFLDGCEDIDRFAALAEWFTEFHVQYLSSAGAVRLYYPDFVAVQATKSGPVHWIIETKGQEFEDTDTKATHMHRWCEEVSKETAQRWDYLKVSQVTFDQFRKATPARQFNALVEWDERQHKFAI
jgi:type III restriction enzyme